MYQIVKKKGKIFGFLTGKSENEIIKKSCYYKVTPYGKPFNVKMLEK